MKLVLCLNCVYLKFNNVLEKWECTRPGWRHYVDNPETPIKCNFYRRRKEGERVKIPTVLRVKLPRSGGL